MRMRQAESEKTMTETLRIVVSGLAATYPFGGVFWDYLQYPLGFLRQGHDVLYIEDTGKWCYDPVQATFVEHGEQNAAYLAEHIQRLDPALSDRWFFRDGTGQTFGQSWQQAAAFCHSADLFLHISASCVMRDEYRAARVVAFIDSDPMYTQVGLLAAGEPEQREQRLAWWKQRHDVFLTFGENIGRPECKVPAASIQWIPTRQPIVLDCFSEAMVPPHRRRHMLTTVASWEPSQKGPVHEGISYAGKSTEFLRFLELPVHSGVPIEVALSGPAPHEQLNAAGWHVVDAYTVSSDPWVYRAYLADSLAECSVAKNAYVASRSGWFSCRSACYLALGVPVIVQDTGFGRVIPTGEGVLAFRSIEEATAAIADLEAHYQRHQRAARRIAEAYFDARVVLRQLLDDVGLG